jgi:hypothetical protein
MKCRKRKIRPSKENEKEKEKEKENEKFELGPQVFRAHEGSTPANSCS